MSATVVILLAGLASFALRMSMIATPRPLGERHQGYGELIAPACLGALAATTLANEVLAAGLSGAAPVLLAAAVGAAASAYTRSGLAAAVAGMPVFWLTTYLAS